MATHTENGQAIKDNVLMGIANDIIGSLRHTFYYRDARASVIECTHTRITFTRTDITRTDLSTGKSEIIAQHVNGTNTLHDDDWAAIQLIGGDGIIAQTLYIRMCEIREVRTIARGEE